MVYQIKPHILNPYKSRKQFFVEVKPCFSSNSSSYANSAPLAADWSVQLVGM